MTEGGQYLGVSGSIKRKSLVHQEDRVNDEGREVLAGGLLDQSEGPKKIKFFKKGCYGGDIGRGNSVFQQSDSMICRLGA